MPRLLVKRFSQVTIVLIVTTALAAAILVRGFTDSRLVSLDWPGESASAFHVRIFAIWRGSAGDSLPQRIKILGMAPGAESVWTYVDPEDLRCYETSGDGAPKGELLGELTPALLRQRLPLPTDFDDVGLDEGLVEVEALIHRIVDQGVDGMEKTPAPASSDDDLGYLKTVEFPHWWTLGAGAGQSMSVSPTALISAAILALSGFILALFVLLRPARRRVGASASASAATA